MINQLILQDSTITLPDGRALAYTEYDDPAGPPIIFFHGSPTTRWWYPGRLTGVASDARVIAFDRPGYGHSDFYTGGGLLECAEDAAHLADRLGLGRFAVVGYSGGGPYAAACAARWPERVTALGLVASLVPLPGDRPGAAAPPAPEHGPDAAGEPARIAGWPAFLAEFEQREGGAPPDAEDSPEPAMPESDLEIAARFNLDAAWAANLTDALRQGLRGYAWDAWLWYHQPWGFALEDIAVPTTVWHGEQDTLVPVEQGRYLAAVIPGAQGRFYPNAGHLFAFDYWNEILATLVG